LRPQVRMDNRYTDPLSGEPHRKIIKMASIIRTMILLLMVVYSGCAPKPLPVAIPKPVPAMPGHSAFQDAERAFENGLYTEALEGYNTFLREADDDPFFDDALFKIGKIYRLTGSDDDAIAVLSRLNREFPESALVSGAKLEILNILFDGGYFESVITYGLAFIEPTDPTLLRTPFFIIVADAYEALGAHLEAARFYYRAWNTASGADVEIAWTKLKNTAEQLSTDDLQQLIAQVTDRRLMGLLLYRLGMAFILDEKYDDALDVLTAFVERFPEHPDYPGCVKYGLFSNGTGPIYPFYHRLCTAPFRSYAIFGQRALNGIELALSQSAEMGAEFPSPSLSRIPGPIPTWP
jgi:branched-chain amino acid transport system substrate-binding protein